MKTSELNFNYPPELVAMEPQRPSRVMWVKGRERQDLTWQDFLKNFGAGDLIVLNDTKVIPQRVWAISSKNNQADILFVKKITELTWEVLAPFKKMKGQKWKLPADIEILEVQPGLPQTIKLSREINADYFYQFGEAPLPPYILQARGNRHSNSKDTMWYQSIFAQHDGSSAAPTASLHFSKDDLEQLKNQGVDFAYLTLHVGLGTYLPVTANDLDEHKMHAEAVHIPIETWRKVGRCNGRVWALGTTVARSLESAIIGKLKKDETGFFGETGLLIQPGYDFKIVRGLLTNFHQPESTLLALVSAFAGLENVKESYAWAIDKKFRLFSYGDLTAWEHS